MQKFWQQSDSPPPGAFRRGNTLRTLSLWAALCGLGTALGCGAEPPVDGSENADSVQKNLTPMCVTESQGGSTSCKDEKTWSAYASMACAGKGLTMTKIAYADSCGAGLYRQTTYDCCSTTPTPTPMCMWAPATGTGACHMPDEWKKLGGAFCATHGLVLNDLKLDRPCTTSGYATAQYECCTIPTPPPPPPSMCSGEALASMTCIDDSTWKTRIEATCKAKGKIVGSVSFGTSCSTVGGHFDVKFECCGPTTPPPPTGCLNQTLASTTCVDDATWKLKAESVCTSRKLTLTRLALGKVCMGGHTDIEFQCCDTTTPPPPPPTMCTTETAASMSCVDDATWKLKADAACTAKKLTLGSIGYGTPCMGGHQDIKYECCGPTTPPPSVCSTETAASMTCIDDATWKSRAEATCKAKKLNLTTLAYGASCMGGHLDVKFACCPTTTPPTPMCTTEKGPSTASCQTPDQWKVVGERVCTAKSQKLTGMSLGGPCTGGFSEAQFTCCPSTPTPPVCSAGLLGDGRTCSTEAAWKSQAEGICKMSSARLTAFSPFDVCGPTPMSGNYLHAKYECCK